MSTPSGVTSTVLLSSSSFPPLPLPSPGRDLFFFIVLNVQNFRVKLKFLPRISKMCNEDKGRFSIIGYKMSAEHQLRVHYISIFFIVGLIYKDSEGMNDRQLLLLI